MGCFSSDELDGSPEQWIDLIPGYTLQQPVRLKYMSTGRLETASNLRERLVTEAWIANERQKQFSIYSHLLSNFSGINVFRSIFIASPDRRTTFCYVQRERSAYLQRHNYNCFTQDGRKLFSVMPDGTKLLIVHIPHLNLRLQMPIGGGRLTRIGAGKRSFIYGDVGFSAGKIPGGVDQMLAIALILIINDIRLAQRIGTAAIAASLAATAPAAPGVAAGMRIGTHFLTANPNARPRARNPEQLLVHAAGDMTTNLASGRNFSDSARATANTSMADGQSVLWNQARGRGARGLGSGRGPPNRSNTGTMQGW